MNDAARADVTAAPATDAAKPTVESLLGALSNERAGVRSLVAGVDVEGWQRPTTPGWSVRDQVAHLASYDSVADLSIGDPELEDRALADIPAFEAEHLRADPADGNAFLAKWERAGEGFRRAAERADPRSRVPWFGPDTGLLSMLSARLMEAWAHGQDVADGLDIRRVPTDRLRHVVGLAVRARPQGYAVRELPVPDAPVRVELTAPTTGPRTFGPEAAEQWVRGPAEDFCLVLTRRRHVDDTALEHVDDTALEHVGPAAREWSEIGQAYAGPAGAGPRRHRESRTGAQ